MPDIYAGRDYVPSYPIGFEDRPDREPPVRVGPSDVELRKAQAYALQLHRVLATGETDRAESAKANGRKARSRMVMGQWSRP
jgi:hypothetical protein